jgi:hypothetical protein
MRLDHPAQKMQQFRGVDQLDGNRLVRQLKQRGVGRVARGTHPADDETVEFRELYSF